MQPARTGYGEKRVPARKTRTLRQDAPTQGSAKTSPALVAQGYRASDALDLEKRVFISTSPKRIAASLKRSAERSQRRKSSPYRSAMSMLTFYINRAGRNLPAPRRRMLNAAKTELRRQFAKD